MALEDIDSLSEKELNAVGHVEDHKRIVRGLKGVKEIVSPVSKINPLTGYWHSDSFGAKGDGIAAEQSYIQNAINACSAAGGGIVYLKTTPAYYKLATSLAPKKNVTFLSHGATIKCSTEVSAFYGSSQDASNFILDGVIFDGGVTEAPTTPKRERSRVDGMVSALAIQGNLDPTVPDAASISNITVKNCVIKNNYGLPILLKGIRGMVSVQQNTFINNRDIGFTHCESVLFNNNYINGSCDNGVSLSRISTKMTCTGNVIENCAYNGIWAAGFLTDPGPTNFSINGNTVKNFGHAGVWLDMAPKFGTVVGNSIDGGYFRGPSDEPSDSACTGIFVGGLGADRSAPVDYATDLVINSNQIRRVPNAGILIAGALKRSLIIGNQISDVGTQYLADGTTVISPSDAQRNIGILVNYATTCSDVTIAMNRISDSRSTPYTNYGMQPVATSSITTLFNEMSGCRNAFNLIDAGQQRNINYVSIFSANTKHTAGADAGSTSATGTIAAFNVNGAAGSVRMNRFRTGSLDRWSEGSNGNTESTGNVGSDFEIRGYANDGTLIGSAFSIRRSNLTVSATKGFVQATKAGIPLDSDFLSTPSDGTTILDTTNHRIYIRSGGVWKYSSLT